MIRRYLGCILMEALLLCAASAGQLPGAEAKKLAYPKAPTSGQVDDYHGIKVADPYRPLEDVDSDAVRTWVDAENKLTLDYLREIPARDQIRSRMKELLQYERYSVPEKKGARYFYSHNSGLQNQAVLYWLNSLDDPSPKLLLDPNTLSADGTVALNGKSISPDGELLAYSVSYSGSDWQEWHMREVSTGRELPDVLKWSKFSGGSFTKDAKGFFYSRYDAPNEASMLRDVNANQKLCYHRLGTPQSDDELIYQRPDHKEWFIIGTVTDDGHYLIIEVRDGTDPRFRIYYKDLTRHGSAVTPLLDQKDAVYNFVDNNGPIFWFVTDLDAPLGKVVAIDTRNPAPPHRRTVIPESKETLLGAIVLNNQFLVSYLKDAHGEARVFDLKGTYLRSIDTPGLGSLAGFNGKRTDRETFYSYTSYSAPLSIYRYDFKTGRSTVFRKPSVKFNPEEYETRQDFCTSKDGTRVPMFITARKGLKLDGNNPTLLYGYGGFGVSLTPAFTVGALVWMEMGGIYVQANLRGGGEYGEPWHTAGLKLHKQVVFDDFIATAEWLIARKYTQPGKLAIHGSSNGGLLVAACLTQRPELFGAALPFVGVLDMLRYQKFTVGSAWIPEFGSSDDAAEFEAIYRYSPLHNVKAGVKYPATLILTAEHDDRVVPAHSFKFAAALQAAQAGDAPVLIRIGSKTGHGAGKPISKSIDEISDAWGFLVKNLGMNLGPWRNNP